MRLENKTIVVTGATSGIGLELVTLLSRYEHTKIVAVGRKIESIPNAQNIHPYRCDVSQKEEVEKLFDYCISNFGKIDVFIANAGFAYYERYNSANWQKLNEIYATNVFSPLYALGKMIELNDKNKFMVVITASIIAKMAIPGYALYASTKFALDGFSMAMHYEMPENGKLCMVYPVATKTRFFETADPDAEILWPAQTALTVAKATINGILRNKKEVYPFKGINTVMSFARLFPFMRKGFLNNRKKSLFRWMLKNK